MEEKKKGVGKKREVKGMSGKKYIPDRLLQDISACLSLTLRQQKLLGKTKGGTG